ncbi:MAG: valine--tRNA ligase [Candidatus Latescibacteria bacterium]|nr:valine--tRNA ligase [Candidatus Latescibacterota bacterium]
MNTADFPTRYEPKEIEKKWYQFWLDNKFFTPDLSSKKPRYCIVIPPPNVTGVLHMGHALNGSLQDILIRFKKLQGFETLWLPGTDHASIATHNQIERRLKADGKTRFDIGREEFLRLAWDWKEKHANIILEQLKTLGASCDWSRTRFTMDEQLSKAVREAFVQYYEKGLIYKAYYIVNWCPRCHTSISDLEVKYKESATKLWYIKYPLKKSEILNPKSETNPKLQNSKLKTDFVMVATTRPETMLGDTAIAVNPNDERYKDLVGRKVVLPLANKEIPIIAESAVDMEFGTGAVKVTPAHDPVDFEIGNRHKLEFVKVINEEAQITDKAPTKYQGLSREKARELVVADLEAGGYLEKIEDYHHRVGTCVRCETLTEPMVSLQWFLKTKPLAEPAIKKVEDKTTKFYPERWTKVYLDWMYNLKDWCISRQLWWGHRIPAFYCDDCNAVMVKREDPKACDKCESKNIQQDEDVLDTWFSSAIWPFSTLGWPEKTKELEQFYPTNVLSTDPDIIFLWVARMIMSGMEFIGKVPFYDVYIHSTLQAETGERMSRSKGIGVDPVVLIDKYGACALRFTLAYLETENQSYRFWEKKVEIGRNFANKIWNAGRLIASLVAGSREQGAGSSKELLTSRSSLSLVDNGILGKFNQTIEIVTGALDRYAYSVAAQELYSFFWHELCDWYLEMCKIRQRNNDNSFAPTLDKVFKGCLTMLHPFMPFLTEEIWHKFGYSPESILQAQWPIKEKFEIRNSKFEIVESMRELIVGIRNIRSEMRIDINKKVECYINTQNKDLAQFLLDESNQKLIFELAKVSSIKQTDRRPSQSSVSVIKECEVYVPLAGLIDFDKERARIKTEIESVSKELDKINHLLADVNFLNKAKSNVIEREKERLVDLQDKLTRLQQAEQALK